MYLNIMLIQPTHNEHFARVANLLNGTSPTVEESDGPYRPPASDDVDGHIIREERVEQIYRIKGTGNVPKVDPDDAVRDLFISI